MPDPTTPAKGLTQPTVGGDNNAWGGLLNTDLALIDAAIGGTVGVSISGNVTLNATQIQNSGYEFTGTLSGTATITWPSFSGMAAIQNCTTGGFSIICKISGGASVTVVNGETVAIWSDGTNFYRLAQVGGGATVSNADLQNSAITIAGHTVSLGGSQALAAADLTNGTIGSGSVVLAASPALTGSPVAPTASSGTNNTQIASTAFVGRAASKFCVTMYPVSSGQSGSTPWIVIDPFGNAISTSGTTTDGLQEAINYAVDNGFPLFVYGQGDTTAGHSFQGSYINCTTTVTRPAMQFASVYLYNVDLNLVPSNPANPGLVIDTSILAGWYHQGQVAYTGTGVAVLFQPQTADPEDGGKGIADSNAFISNIAAVPGSSPTALVQVDLTHGGANGCFYDFVELNGSGVTTTAFSVVNPNGSTGWTGNTVRIAHAHLTTGPAIQIGSSTSNQADFTGNIYSIGYLAPSGASAVGIQTYESYAQYTVGSIGNYEGAFNKGVVVESGASGNAFEIGEITGQSGAGAATIVDGGTGTGYRVGAALTLNNTLTTLAINGVSGNNLNISAEGAAFLVLNAPSGQVGALANGGAEYFFWNNGVFFPSSDLGAELGTSGFRFSAVHGKDHYSSNAAAILHSETTITGGSTSNTPTLTAGPVSGNPTKWLPYDDNGTIRYIPAW